MTLGPRLMTNQSGGSRGADRGPAPPIKYENRIGIQAPSEILWELLYDLSSWHRWSVIYKKAEGELRIDARLSITEALPGAAERSFSPKVVDWVPYEPILWADAPWRGWVKCLRYIEIEEVDKGACIVASGEQIGGFLGDIYAERRRLPLKKGFLAFNQALKTSAEAMWSDRK